MASETTKKVFKEVRPILSLDRHEAKRRVINLYKAWYRQIPFIGKTFLSCILTRELLRQNQSFTANHIVN